MPRLSISNFNFFVFKCLCILLLLCFTFVIAFQLYNPLDLKSGNDSEKNITRTYVNNYIKELPSFITVRNNNIGYIGENYFDSIKRVKVLFFGSSTTQSIYIPFDSKWTTLAVDQNKIWSNNCGIDGSSITQWIEETRKVKSIRPHYIVILINPFISEKSSVNSNNMSFERAVNKINIYKYVIKPFCLSKFARNIQSGHKKVIWKDLIKANPNNKLINFDLNKSQERLNQLVKSIKESGATPIFISHPTPFGNYIDKNGNDMSKLDESISIDSFYSEFSNFLFSYCIKEKIPFINGYQLQKNSDYFYDFTHFSLIGSSEFALFIKSKLDTIFSIDSIYSNNNLQLR